jgi:5-methylcytosine-specific restriction endonuclease McrA
MDASPLNANVLVLNQNYEPLTICSVKRALVMLFCGRVESIADRDGHRIRTVSTSVPCPSVVRVDRYVRRPRTDVLLSRRNIIKRDNHTCQYCGTRGGPMTVDHIIPRTMGGTDRWSNLVCACMKCNNRKGDRTPRQAGMTLLRRPRRPNHVTYMQLLVSPRDRAWKPYLFLPD